MTTHTPGPWTWTAYDAGPEDEYGCATRGPIDPATFKSKGYYANPELVGPNEARILSGGGGEYMPYDNPADARLIAAAPDTLSALRVCAGIVDSFLNGQGAVTVDEMNAALMRADAAIAKATA